jgi:hypothetical protein
MELRDNEHGDFKWNGQLARREPTHGLRVSMSRSTGTKRGSASLAASHDFSGISVDAGSCVAASSD